MTLRRPLAYAVLLFLAVSCGPQKEEETTTKGHLRVLVSESVAPVIIQGVQKFMNLYQAHGADVTYTIDQSAAVNAHFVHDTARAIITTIQLTPEEKERVKNTTENLVEIVLGYDGVIAVVQTENPLKKLGLDKIRRILQGKATTWKQIGNSHLGNDWIHLVFQDSSDVSMYLRQRLLAGGEIKAKFRQTRSASQTLNTVARDPLALGFVGLDWADSAGSKVKVLDLAADSSLADTTFKPPPETIGKAYSPHPAHIYLNYYPMKRAIYIYARTSPADFATGFASYLGSPPGQKIFLEQGLVPGTQKIVLRPTGGQ